MDGDNVIPLPQLVLFGKAKKEHKIHKDDKSNGKVTIKPNVSSRKGDRYYFTNSITNEST